MTENHLSLRERLRLDLIALEERAQLRRLASVGGINLCSNDYLGLSLDPRLKQAVADAVRAAPAISSTGSRLLSGNSREWEELEADFAQFAGAEAALYFSSGYAANVGLFSSLLKPVDTVFSDRLNHASIIDGIRLSGARKIIYPHGDLEALREALEAQHGQPGARVIITESVFSMDGDTAPLLGLGQLANEYHAELVIDEAHATGVFGPRGRGLAAELGIEKEVLAIVHTCGKALATMGGFVCGPESLKQYLINHARPFIFSTAPPPYLAAQIGAAMRLAEEAEAQRTHLMAMANVVRAKLRAAGLNIGSSSSQIIPLIVGSNQAALHIARQLQSREFAVRAIRPPTVPEGSSRLRLSLTSAITLGQATYLADSIINSIDELPHSATLASHA